MTIIKILLWFKTSELNSEVGGGICLVPLFINDPPPPNFQNPKFTTPTLLNLKSTTPSKSQISRPLPNVLTPPPPPQKKYEFETHFLPPSPSAPHPLPPTQCSGKNLCWSRYSPYVIKLQVWRSGSNTDWKPATLLKRDSNTGVFLSILRNF